DLRIGEGDLAEIRMPLVLRRERFRRPVRGVRVVQMNPREEGLPACLIDPRQRLVYDLVAGPLDGAERDRSRFAEIELVVVGVEALVEPPLRIEDVGGDEGTGTIAARFQHFGERELLGSEEEA